ncbi:MAG: XdhC family protein [Candidatus Hydrogenedentes bacterium]|nr:XdhC family protein [Candidatus Hydrogenedentota bacterium]
MNFYSKLVSLIDAKTPFAFAAVVTATGSTPQKAGAKAIFEPSGAIYGTLGGGCLEAESRRRAMDALDSGTPLLFDLNLNDDYGWDDGLICGGNVRVFIDPAPVKNRDAFARASALIDDGRRGVLVTLADDIENIGKAICWEEGAPIPEDVRLTLEQLQACLDKARPQLVSVNDASYYLEPIERTPTLLIAGGGHVGQATAKLATWLGFEVTVIDDRPAFTQASLYSEGVQTICGDIPKEVAKFPIDSTTYILIVTRGHRHDGVVLKECIHSTAAYIGMIGSRRKVHIIRQGFLDEGIATEQDFQRIHAPVGLDIGALSVEEIATSIAAELVAVRRKKTGIVRPMAEFVPQ